MSNTLVDDNFQACDSPSGSSTSEPHDEAISLQQPSFIDQSFFYKLDQLSPDNPLYFMQQQQHIQQQQQQQQQYNTSQTQNNNMHTNNVPFNQQSMTHPALSPSLSPQPSAHSPSQSSMSQSMFADPLLPNNHHENDANPTFWSGFNSAIPNLAKNFTDYISGYSIPQEQQQFNPQQTATSVSTNETLATVKTSIPGMQIRVLGVPQTGAKSRVETQIKLCIQLVTDDGDKAQWWSHLKLPEHMVAKDKLKRQSTPNGSKYTSIDSSHTSIKPEKMLFLSARVICASDPSRKVVTCLGCIQRERKRSQRRKENKIKSENEEDRRMVEDEKSLAMEEQKVLLFNCSELVDFTSGDTILPTRITCYCRHHNERLGFCIYFEMHDHTGKQVATGMSPPIMITDDHKSNKIKAGRKRLRTDVEKPSSSSVLSNHAFNARQGTAPMAQPFHQQPPSSFYPNQYQIQPRPTSKPASVIEARSPITPLDSPMVTASTSPFIHHEKAGTSSPSMSVAPPQQVTNAVEKPLLQRLIPNEGPTFGGVEVTLLGSGFRSGLTCMFGDVAASSTHYWSPNTLVCILPPAVEAGTVVVSFKEYPLVIDSQDVTLFTYYNENDRALMELALQVVGLKMTGKVEDARDIAMRIVQGGNTGGGSNNNNNGGDHSTTTVQNRQMNLERHIIQVLQVMSTFRDVESADVSITSAQGGHTMLHLAAMLGFAELTLVLIQLGCDLNSVDKNGYTALHYCAWYNHECVVSVLLEHGADPEISNMWNKKPLHLAENTTIKHTLWNHETVIEEEDFTDSLNGYTSSDMMSADVDTSFAEDETDQEDSVWLSDTDSIHEPTTTQHWRQSYASDSEESTSSIDHTPTLYEGIRHRKRSVEQTNTIHCIKYLNEEEFTSHSAEEIMDAQPIHDIEQSTDYEDNVDETKEMNWMQRTLSHFQQPTDNNSFLQNIKNNIPAKPAELNLKNIADHLLQFPRPATMIANMSGLFSTEDDGTTKPTQGEPAEQTLAWYMALAYAMGARSLDEEEEQKQQQPPPYEARNNDYRAVCHPPSSSTSGQAMEAAKKRRDKRLFSFWVPMLCLMVIWLIYQFISSHPGVVDTIIGISGFRRQYLTIH